LVNLELGYTESVAVRFEEERYEHGIGTAVKEDTITLGGFSI
jgi:hypothetical protein